MTGNEPLPAPVRVLRPPAAESDPPIATFPRLGHGIRWSDVTADIEADHRARLAQSDDQAA
ncbi:DUF6222 family protein [Amycolatopsis sp. H20-H5]|uniref:DUF6222 family protein n=1 Tax=Amycolatopsis sp. H20-H5 TaxID=3046309 RepID=UPI002DBF152A|nr:DUF6222 family protein [Amycolatopsis sp. H20-H5]MEC3976937.1 DUF6222 family protein [Amycolatopsis sp. H20-H5]